jgi:hypothetical protein
MCLLRAPAKISRPVPSKIIRPLEQNIRPQTVEYTLRATVGAEISIRRQHPIVFCLVGKSFSFSVVRTLCNVYHVYQIKHTFRFY